MGADLYHRHEAGSVDVVAVDDSGKDMAPEEYQHFVITRKINAATLHQYVVGWGWRRRWYYESGRFVMN